MKHTLAFVAILVVCLTAVVLTGFQCGSTEMTSAKLYIQRQDWPGAEKALSKEVEKNPKNAEAWYDLGYARLQMKAYPGALVALNKSLEASNDFAGKVRDAKLVGWAGSLNDGVIKYNNSLDTSLSKDSAKAMQNRAVEAYKTAIQFEPDSLVTYNRLAIAYMAGGDYENEIAALKLSLSHRKDFETYRMIINTYSTMADNARSNGQKETAKTFYNDAINVLADARSFDPKNMDFLKTMIDLYIAAGRADDAKPAMREALANEPTNKLYLYNLGVLLMESDTASSGSGMGYDSLRTAIKYFEDAVAADPKYEDALGNCASCYMKIGIRMYDAAKTRVEEKKDKELSRAYIAEFKKAVGLLERLRDIRPTDANVWDALGRAYVNAGMKKEGQSAQDKADALRKK